MGVRLGWNGIDQNQGQGARVSEMGWYVLKDELRAGQRQASLMSVGFICSALGRW